MSDTTQRPFFTTAQAAEQLGLTHTAVLSAIRRGTLAAERVSTRFSIVYPDAIEAYRRDHLGQSAWRSRRDPTTPPTKAALYKRAWRERKKAQGTAQVAHADPDTNDRDQA